VIFDSLDNFQDALCKKERKRERKRERKKIKVRSKDKDNTQILSASVEMCLLMAEVQKSWHIRLKSAEVGQMENFP
jgi:hypothetical protein